MARPRRAVPTGTLTFLFSDIEGSTRLVQEVGTARYRELLEEHQRMLRAAFAANGGIERSTEGDSFFVVFRDAPAAVAAAVAAQRALGGASWTPGAQVRVRMGLHSGQAIAGGDDYVGLDVHRAARIAAAAHGGQVIVSESARALAQHALPDGVGLMELGAHRLRGLAAIEHLYQLTIAGLPSTYPPPRTDPVSAAHLPPRLTSFIGRDADLVALQELLAANRLITLVGPGGAGKTSLATECARAVSGRFADGAWFVGLEALSDPDLVAPAIVSALGLQDPGGRHAEDQLQENLAHRELLLVLDNFEQVMHASTLVGAILTAAPTVKVIATSRAPLHLSAEQVYPVDPLPVPRQRESGSATTDPSMGLDDLAALLEVPSVRLFVDRTQQVLPSFRLTFENAASVADICARLDGLPLGIELAAARIPLLGARGVAERLARHVALPATPAADAPARQRTLHQAIAWSYDLLEPAARALFARLSIFRGGWLLDEAEAVCEPATEPGGDVLELLARLVDQSLVVAREQGGGVRYEMLETIRDFAVRQLAARSDLLEVGRRHAQTYLRLAEEMAPAIRRRNRVAALQRIGPERDNLRAAVRWSIAHGDADTALRLSTALVELRGAPPWGVTAAIHEARTTILAALDVPGAGSPTITRMRALEAAGTAFYYIGDNERAGTLYRAQLELAEQVGDPMGAADARFNLGWTVDWTGRSADADRHFDRVSNDYRALGDERGLARVSFMRGQTLLRAGHPEEAIAVLRQAIERYRELDDVSYISMTAGALGSAYLQLGDRDAAIHWFISGVFRTARELGDEVAMAMTLPIGATAALEVGRPEAAAMIMGAHEALSRVYGVRPPIALELVFETYGPLERAKAQLDPLVYEATLERGRQMSLAETVALVAEMEVSAPDEPTG